MTSLFERLARCDREIANAIAESHQPHTEAEHAGILIWEMDWRAERETILQEIAGEKAACSPFGLEHLNGAAPRTLGCQQGLRPAAHAADSSLSGEATFSVASVS
jgi:hypothetical protein